MAVVPVKLDINTKAGERKLLALAQVDRLALHQSIAAGMHTLVQLGFKTGTDPWGKPWAPIKWRAPRMGKRGITKAGRAQMTANAAGTPGQILRDKGTLQSSLTPRVDAGGVTVGSNLIYAGIHQFGGVILPKKGPRLVFPGPAGLMIFAKKVVIPRRAFLPIEGGGTVNLPAAWHKALVGRVLRYLSSLTKGGGA